MTSVKKNKKTGIISKARTNKPQNLRGMRGPASEVYRSCLRIGQNTNG